MVAQAVSDHLHDPFQLVACPLPLLKYFKTKLKHEMHRHLLFSQLQNNDVKQLLGLGFLGA